MVTERTDVILVIEDNPLDLDLMVRALKATKLPNPVKICRDGAEALDYVHRRGNFASDAPVPVLVLLDLKLPKVDGIEVLREMRGDAAYRFVPVVIFSTSMEERDVANAYQHGASSYVPKAVNFDQFVASVNQVSQYWLTVNHSVPRA